MHRHGLDRHVPELRCTRNDKSTDMHGIYERPVLPDGDTIGAGGSGAVTIAIGTAQTASGSSGTVTAGLKANGTSLTYTPAATYTGTIGISAKLITPISTFSVTGKDSTGAVYGVVLWQTLASLHNSFSGGGGRTTPRATTTARRDTRPSTPTPRATTTARRDPGPLLQHHGLLQQRAGSQRPLQQHHGLLQQRQGSTPSTATPRASTTAHRDSTPSTATPRAPTTAHRETWPSTATPRATTTAPRETRQATPQRQRTLTCRVEQ